MQMVDFNLLCGHLVKQLHETMNFLWIIQDFSFHCLMLLNIKDRLHHPNV